MKTKYIDWGIGNRVGNTIYLNKNLKQYPRLHKAILEHEKNHSDDWELKDLVMDLQIDELKGLKGKYYWFVLTHPKSWVNFLPVMKIEGRWCVDPDIIISWILMIIILGTISVILK